MPAFRSVPVWHPECNFALQVNTMSRRDALPQRSALYVDPEEVYEDQPTRAERPSYVDEPTRSPRESYVALSELPNIASSSPMSAPYEDSPTRIAPARAAKISYVAPIELERDFDREEEDYDDEVTSFVDRSSLIAASELEQVEEVEEVEEIEHSMHEPLASGPADYEALSRYLFDDIASVNEALPPPVPETELHAENGTLLLAPQEEPPTSYRRHPAMCIRTELHARTEHDMQPRAPQPPPPVLATRRSRYSMHDAEQSSPAPAFSARPPMRSHHAFEMGAYPPPMSSRRSMPSVHPHDSSAESPWIIPAVPSTRRRAELPAPAPFQVTPSLLASAFVGLLAITVMVAGVLFVRSDDRARTTTSTASAPVPSYAAISAAAAESATNAMRPYAAPPPSVIVISSDDVAPFPSDAPVTPRAVATTVIAPAPLAPQAAVVPSAPVEAQPVMIAPTAKPAAAPPAAAPPTARPVATKKSDGKVGAKSVEDILNELGEEQLRR